MFGIGGSKQSAQASSTSQSFQEAASESTSLGTSRGASVSGAASTQTQDIAFADLFARLYGGAAGAAGQVTGEPLRTSADMLFSGGTQFLDTLQNAGAGEQYLAGRVRGESPVLQEQIAGLQSDFGKLFREELNPAIGARAASGGALGGGRQGVAQAGAIGEVAREFGRGATALRASDIASRDAAARDLASQRTQAAGVGLGALGGLLDVKQRGTLAGLAPYQALSGILGGPTVLSQGQSTSFGESLTTSDQVARAVSQSFGESESESKSKSKGKAGSISFGS